MTSAARKITDTQTLGKYVECHIFIVSNLWPYIPTITGVDDTSNFDKLDPEEEQPTFGNKMPMKKAFCGKNLRFVGFTFMKCDNE